MKIFSKLLIAFVSLLSCYFVILACAGGDWTEEDAKSSFFYQNIMIEKDIDSTYLPFFRKVTEPFYGNQLGDYHNNTLFKDQNVEEWKEHFKGDLHPDEISWILYESSLEEIDHLIFYSKDKAYKKIPAALSRLNMFLLKDQDKLREFLFYVGFARRCEKVAAIEETSEWDYDASEYKKKENFKEKYVAELIENGEKMLDNPKSNFVKERYMFQILRLKFQQAQAYTGKYSECAEYYLAHETDFKVTNTIKYRALGYVASCYHKTGKYAEANLLYARIYDKCPEMRTVAQYSFHPMEEADFMKSLSLATNDREKATLWHLLGLYGDEGRAMGEIYALTPKSDLLNLLIVRQVSKLEEEMLPLANYWPEYDDDGNEIKVDNSYRLKPEAIKDADFQFIKAAADRGNTDKPFLWNFSTGYLYLVKGDYGQSRSYFSKAKGMAGTDKTKLDQLRIMEIVIKIAEPAIVTREVEESLVEDFKWLDTPSPSAKAADYEKAYDEEQMKKEEVKTFLFKIFSQKYLKQDEILKATMCDANCVAGFYYDNSKLDMMAAYLLKKEKSAFEKIMQDHYQYKVTDIYEIQAIRLAYKGDIEGAISKFEKNGAGEGMLQGNPFNININDCHDCDHAMPQKRKFTKLDFMSEVKKMQDIVAKTPSTNDYFLLANAFYNMTYFGNARVFYSSAISDTDTYGTYFFPLSYNGEWQNVNEQNSFIFDCSMAERYYLMAANSTKDKEMKAKCMFMAAKCEQNSYFCKKDEKDARDFKAGKYFNILKSDYSKTKYYKEILKECGYFRKFAGK